MLKPAKEYPDKVVYTAAHHLAGKKYGMTEYQLRGISPGVSPQRAEETRAILQEAYEQGFVYVPMKDIPQAQRLIAAARNALPPGLFVAIRDKEPEQTFLAMLKERQTITMAGTRRYTPYGRKVVWRRMEKMQDAVLVTAFGHGVAQEAAQKAMERKIPLVSVMAVGPGDCYPPALKETLQKLLETPGCAVVTPFFPHFDTSPESYRERNLVTALLGDETLIPQSMLSGNGMDIARKAKQMGKAVYAATGPFDDAYSTGCLQLIAEGTAQPWMPWDVQSYSDTINDLSKED